MNESVDVKEQREEAFAHWDRAAEKNGIARADRDALQALYRAQFTMLERVEAKLDGLIESLKARGSL